MPLSSQLSVIRPLDYIVDWDPPDEAVPDVDAWYETEYITLTVTRASGLASGEAAGFGSESVGWLLAQGWVMTSAGESSGSVLKSVNEQSGTRHFSDGSKQTYLSKTSSIVGQYKKQRAKFKRVRINPRVLLKHMIGEFTKGYNEGRRLNDQRYDELVKLYAALAVKTQEDANRVSLSGFDFSPLVEQMVRGILALPDDYGRKVDAVVATIGGGGELAINERFDELVAKAKSDLVSRGLWNSTLYAATIAEIERQRAIALDEARAKNASLKLSALDAAASLRTKLADAILSLVERQTYKPAELRFNALKAMFDFMERRTDDYPGLAEIAGIVKQIGYADGGTLVPSSSAK